ncbi:MAG: hypothetical protein ABI675_01070 [Chitinophagaceae bacterium]
MGIIQKIIATIIAFILLGIVITLLYEQAGQAPGDGAVGFVLFTLFIIAVIFIWSSKAKKSPVKKDPIQSVLSPEESEPRSHSTGLYTDLLYSDEIDSVATTVKHIIQPLNSLGFTGTRDKTEVLAKFTMLLGQRAQAAMMGGATTRNYLLNTGVNVYNGMYEECFVVDTDKYKLDLSLFVFTAMYLESYITREALVEADSILKNEFFECIYSICLNSYPMQAQFTKEEAIEVMNKFCRFLQRRYMD